MIKIVFIKKYYKGILLVFGLLAIVVSIGIIQVLVFDRNPEEDAQIENTEEELVIQTNLRDESVLQIKVITDYINIRREASVNADILGKVYQDEIYTVLEVIDGDFDWYFIETSNGIKGYIAGKSGENEYIELLPAQESGEVILEEDDGQIDHDYSDTSLGEDANSWESDNEQDKLQDEEDQEVYPSDQESSVPDNNQSSDQSQEEKSDDEIIAATLEYYCSSGYKLDGDTCVKTVYSDIVSEKEECGFGYYLSEDGNKCIGEDREDTEPTIVAECVGGDYDSLYEIGVAPYYGCRKGVLNFKRVCPRGYSLVGSTCRWDYTGKETFVGTTCTYEYPVTDKETGLCVKRTVRSAYQRYTCPSGYRNIKDKCYKKKLKGKVK